MPDVRKVTVHRKKNLTPYRIAAIPYGSDMNDGLSTAQAAKLVGVSKRTLLEWIYRGELDEPKRVSVMGQLWRIWKATDIKRARELKTRMKPGPKPKR